MDSENVLPLLIGFAVVTAVAVAAVSAPLLQKTTEEGDLLQWENHITVEKNGVVIARFTNVLTDQGENFIQDKISPFNATVNGAFIAGKPNRNATFIAVGNLSAPSSTDDQLPGEITGSGLARVDALGNSQTKRFNNSRFQVQNQFTVSAGSSFDVNTTSLNWNSSGPSIISGGSFTGATLQDSDQLTVTHNISIS